MSFESIGDQSKDDESLANLVKQSTQPRGKRKGRTKRERTQVRVRSSTTQSESQRGKGTKVVEISN
jgi:hypothetical protein